MRAVLALAGDGLWVPAVLVVNAVLRESAAENPAGFCMEVGIEDVSKEGSSRGEDGKIGTLS